MGIRQATIRQPFIVIGTALLFTVLSYYAAKTWVVHLNNQEMNYPPGNDLYLGLVTFLGGAVPAAMLLVYLVKDRLMQMAMMTGAAALLFMGVQGFIFILLYTTPVWLYALMVFMGFVGMVLAMGYIKEAFVAKRRER